MTGAVFDLPTLVQNAEVHELGLVGDVQLVEDDGDFPWVGALRSYRQISVETLS
jgi:hypothetical protein